MPDITMCTGRSTAAGICPSREYCYRYTAQRSIRQSMFSEAPWVPDDRGGIAKCDYYWPVDEPEAA